MDRCLLKNIIILILVLVNGFLLGSLIMRHTSATESRRQAEDQLVALFAADGIELSPDSISHETPPSALSLSRSLQREEAAAALFLGDGMEQTDLGGGSYTYSSSMGAARFHPNGSFDIVGSLASSEEAQQLCREFCKTFSYEDPIFSLDEDGSGSVTVVCLWGKYPVFNCTVTFTFDRGTLLTVSGTLLPESGTAVSSTQEPLSASAALTTFQQTRRESYMVVSAITDLYLCYELQGSTASALSLSPAWCIVTDTANHYVNCVTGTVSSN